MQRERGREGEREGEKEREGERERRRERGREGEREGESRIGVESFNNLKKWRERGIILKRKKYFTQKYYIYRILQIPIILVIADTLFYIFSAPQYYSAVPIIFLFLY